MYVVLMYVNPTSQKFFTQSEENYIHVLHRNRLEKVIRAVGMWVCKTRYVKQGMCFFVSLVFSGCGGRNTGKINNIETQNQGVKS